MRLLRREKLFVSSAVIFTGMFFLFHFLVFPFFEARARIKRGIRAKERGLRQIAALSSEYKKYSRGSRGVEDVLSRRNEGFTLFSFLEKAAGDAGVKTYIKYMKPSASGGVGNYKESLVEMKLEEITLQKLVDYLYRIESPENAVSIKRFSIKKNKKNPGSLDAILQVLTFE